MVAIEKFSDPSKPGSEITSSTFPPASQILVIKDRLDMEESYIKTLRKNGYLVKLTTPNSGLDLLTAQKPNLYLLDLNSPGLGLNLIHKLKGEDSTQRLPITMLSSSSDEKHEIRALEAGAEYIKTPVTPKIVQLRVDRQLQQFEKSNYSPLTGLPSNLSIEETIIQLVKTPNLVWSVLYVDIDFFKPYNDTYGFLSGNEVILSTAQILVESSHTHHLGQGPAFVGHIGGDDFIVAINADGTEILCETIIHEFDQAKTEFYSTADLERGYIFTKNRRREFERFPLLGVSIGVVTNRHRVITNHLEVGLIASQVKDKAKQDSSELGKGCYYIDRRGD